MGDCNDFSLQSPLSVDWRDTCHDVGTAYKALLILHNDRQDYTNTSNIIAITTVIGLSGATYANPIVILPDITTPLQMRCLPFQCSTDTQHRNDAPC